MPRRQVIKLVGVFAGGFFGGVAATIGLLLSNAREPVSQGPENPYAEMDRTFERMPELEAMVAGMLRTVSVKGEIRVYLDRYNPWHCAHADAELRAITITQRCSEPLRRGDKPNWFVIGTLGHEVGHILSGHGVVGHDLRDPEGLEKAQAEADEFAGWVLRRHGATLEEAKEALRVEQHDFAERIPATSESMAAIERGWRNAGTAD